MKKAPNPKIFLILALATFVAGAGANYLAYTSLDDAQGKVKSLRSQVKPTSEVQSELEKSNKDLADTTSQLKFLEAGVPDFAYVPTMLAQLEQFGKQNGIEVTGVRPGPPPAANLKAGDKPERKAYDELIIEVKGHGKYGDVMKFVNALHTFPKIIATRSISMTPKIDLNHTGTGGLDVTIELKAFVFAQAAAPVAGDGDTKPATTGSQPATAGSQPANAAPGGKPATTAQPPASNAKPSAPSPKPTAPKPNAKPGQTASTATTGARKNS